MAADVEGRKRRALELLASGQTVGVVCEVLSIKRHKIRAWKENDSEFRSKWNKLMGDLGRDLTDGGRKMG